MVKKRQTNKTSVSSMKKVKLSPILIITIFAFIYGQPEDCTNGRYLNENFDVSVNYGIEYGENVNRK